jgi:hypothetical protein
VVAFVVYLTADTRNLRKIPVLSTVGIDNYQETVAFCLFKKQLRQKNVGRITKILNLTVSFPLGNHQVEIHRFRGTGFRIFDLILNLELSGTEAVKTDSFFCYCLP